MDQDITIEEAYHHMVSSRPSKILSSWTYESKPKPLRSSRMAGEFQETEVSYVYFFQNSAFRIVYIPYFYHIMKHIVCEIKHFDDYKFLN